MNFLYFLVILIVPFCIVAAGVIYSTKNQKNRFGINIRQITIKEFLILISVSIIIAALSIVFIYHQNVTHDEIWNGLVTKKVREKVSCEHSYSCNCRESCSGSGKNRSCSTTCDTCYEHPYDFSYRVHDNTGERFTIDRIDRQGLKTPQRFDQVKIGEPTSSKHEYKDYVKASKGNLFSKEAKYEGFKIPEYPFGIYDYYRLDRFIVSEVPIKNIGELQTNLSEMNGRISPAKQCNIIINLVKKQNPNYIYALDQKWRGGNKNDIIIVISVDETNKKIEWVNVICLANSDIFRVKLRDSIMSIGTLDMPKIYSEIESNVRVNYQRKRMRDFEYLSASIAPTEGQLLVATIINSIICFFLTLYFYKN